MNGSTGAQRCPFCGEAPMSRLQYLVVPGTRSKCRRCGRAIRLRLTRGQTLIIVLAAMVTGGLIAVFAESAPAFTVGLLLLLVVGLAFDQWAWRRIPWVPDAQLDARAGANRGAADAPAEGRALETADR